MSLNWLVADLLKSAGRGEEMGPDDNPPVPDTWYAEVFRRVMPAGYDPTWSRPTLMKSDSARKQKEYMHKKSWEKNPTLTQAARHSKDCCVERTGRMPGRGLQYRPTASSCTYLWGCQRGRVCCQRWRILLLFLPFFLFATPLLPVLISLVGP